MLEGDGRSQGGGVPPFLRRCTAILILPCLWDGSRREGPELQPSAWRHQAATAPACRPSLRAPLAAPSPDDNTDVRRIQRWTATPPYRHGVPGPEARGFGVHQRMGCKAAAPSARAVAADVGVGHLLATRTGRRRTRRVTSITRGRGGRQGCIGTAQNRFDRRSEEEAEAVGGGYCRLQMPLKPALAVRGTVAGHRPGALERGGGGAADLPVHPRGAPLVWKHHWACTLCTLQATA